MFIFFYPVLSDSEWESGMLPIVKNALKSPEARVRNTSVFIPSANRNDPGVHQKSKTAPFVKPQKNGWWKCSQCQEENYFLFFFELVAHWDECHRFVEIRANKSMECAI